MATVYEYVVQIAGSNFDFEYMEWDDELCTVKEVTFSTLEEARQFVKSITEQQVIDWERKTGCNGLDVVIWEEEVEDGVYDFGFAVVGEKEWIGDQVNGVWM